MLVAPKDRAGRIQVDSHMNIQNNPKIFVVGDAATFSEDGRVLPGVAQVALQQGEYVGSRIAGALAGRPIERAFHYRDKGNMAVVGKNFAALETKRLRMAELLSWFA
jgi:NADH dehydrogenase